MSFITGVCYYLLIGAIVGLIFIKNVTKVSKETYTKASKEAKNTFSERFCFNMTAIICMIVWPLFLLSTIIDEEK